MWPLHVACPFGLSDQVAGSLTWHLRNSQVQKQTPLGLPKAEADGMHSVPFATFYW